MSDRIRGFKRYSAKEKVARVVGALLTIPLDMWIIGIAAHAVSGHDISRGESLAVFMVIGMFGASVGLSVRQNLVGDGE